MLVLEDEISGAASNSPELYQENFSFFAGASVPNRASASPTRQSEMGQKVTYTPDYWGQAGKQYINYEKNLTNIFSQHTLKTLNLNFLMKHREQLLDRKSLLSSAHPHKGLFHVLKGLRRSQTTQKDCLFPGIEMIDTFRTSVGEKLQLSWLASRQHSAGKDQICVTKLCATAFI